jgi:hypothetical protein
LWLVWLLQQPNLDLVPSKAKTHLKSGIRRNVLAMYLLLPFAVMLEMRFMMKGKSSFRSISPTLVVGLTLMGGAVLSLYSL